MSKKAEKQACTNTITRIRSRYYDYLTDEELEIADQIWERIQKNQAITGKMRGMTIHLDNNIRGRRLGIKKHSASTRGAMK